MGHLSASRAPKAPQKRGGFDSLRSTSSRYVKVLYKPQTLGEAKLHRKSKLFS